MTVCDGGEVAVAVAVAVVGGGFGLSDSHAAQRRDESGFTQVQVGQDHSDAETGLSEVSVGAAAALVLVVVSPMAAAAAADGG